MTNPNEQLPEFDRGNYPTIKAEMISEEFKAVVAGFAANWIDYAEGHAEQINEPGQKLEPENKDELAHYKSRKNTYDTVGVILVQLHDKVNDPEKANQVLDLDSTDQWNHIVKIYDDVDNPLFAVNRREKDDLFLMWHPEMKLELHARTVQADNEHPNKVTFIRIIDRERQIIQWINITEIEGKTQNGIRSELSAYRYQLENEYMAVSERTMSHTILENKKK